MSMLGRLSTAIVSASIVVSGWASHASQPNTCDLHERQKVQPSDGAAGDHFGHTGIDGDHVIVGAPHDEHAGYHSGSAYIFRFDDNGTPGDPYDDHWLEQAKLTASDADVNDVFGAYTDISGDWAVVGAIRNDDRGESSGAAYIFRRDDWGTPLDPTDDSWVEQAKLFPENGSIQDHFGQAVAISGDRALIGAPYHDGGLHQYFNNGTAYVYKRHDHGTPDDPSDDLWQLEQELAQQNAQADDFFGLGVAIERDCAVVGSYRDDIVGTDAGAATVFYRINNSYWFRGPLLTASDATMYDRFGLSLGVSGRWIVVGSLYDDDLGEDSGSVYVFRADDNGTPDLRADDTWIEHCKLHAADGAAGDLFGFSVSIDGDWIAADSLHEQGEIDGNGATYVFQRNNRGTPDHLADDVWVQRYVLTSSDMAPNDEFGGSDLSDRRIIAGATYDDGPDEPNMGSAYVFEVGRDCLTLQDFAQLQNCYGGASGVARCEVFDFDSDGNVDHLDYEAFLLNFSGP